MEYKFEPFEKVLGRNSNFEKWSADLFSNISNDSTYCFTCLGYAWKQCIPYAGNEHLLGTNNNPESEHEYKWGDKVEYLNSFEEWAPAIFVEKMPDGGCLLVIRRRTENVFCAVGSEKEIRPLKED